jgi:hypothetical protein
MALVPVACATAGSPTHAQFVARANAICAKESARGSALGTPSSAAEAVIFLRKAIPIVADLRAATLALPAPAADLPLIKAGMNDIAKELTYLRKARVAASRDDLAAYQTAMSKAHSFNEAGAAWSRKLGLADCSG